MVVFLRSNDCGSSGNFFSTTTTAGVDAATTFSTNLGTTTISFGVTTTGSSISKDGMHAGFGSSDFTFSSLESNDVSDCLRSLRYRLAVRGDLRTSEDGGVNGLSGIDLPPTLLFLVDRRVGVICPGRGAFCICDCIKCGCN